MTVLITGGTVVGPTGSSAMDVLIDGERIAALLEPGSTRLGSDLAATAERVIDATGKYVIPGGVDCHTHMELPFGGTYASRHLRDRHAGGGVGRHDDDHRLRRAAHRRARPGRARRLAREGRRAAARSTTASTRSSAASTTTRSRRWTSWSPRASPRFKLFMAYPGVFYSDDGQILRAMQTAAANGAMVMMHAENGIAIDVLVHQALSRGETAPVYHGLTRPWQTEEEATHRAIMLARLTGAPLYVVHMSAKQAVAHARRRTATRARTSSARRARSTSTSRSRSSWRAAGLRGREVGLLDAAALARPRATRTSCGSTCAPTTCRSSAPTTARSA